MYRAALAAGHEPYERVDVWYDGARVYEGLPFVKGTVSANLTSRVTREAQFTLHEDWYPWEDTDLLAPYGTELRAYKGIRYGNNEPVYWPTFIGKIQDVDIAEGAVIVRAADRAAEVVENKFTAPESSVAGEPVPEEVRRVIRGRLPGATFGTDDVFYERVPVLVWENDPGSALDEMATAVGAFWYALASAEFVLRRYPWTVRRDPVLTLTDGDGGTVLASAGRRQRDGIYNVVTVTGERADGSTPVSGTDEDTDPASRTYAAGPFGRRGLLRRLNTPGTTEVALGAAKALRRRTTGTTHRWSFTAIPDAALELGDVLDLRVRGRNGIVQVVESFTLPYGGGSMGVSCRAQVIDLLDEG